MTFLLDQRDHGRSPHTTHFDYPSLAEDLYHFLDSNWIHKTILIGHSMGGKTGLQFCAEHSDMVSKFVCIDIGPKEYYSGHQDVFDALNAIKINKVNSRDQVQEILMSHLLDLGTVLFLMKNLSRKKEGGFEWKMNLPLLYRDYDNILAAIDFDQQCEVETLFIRGANSRYILDEDIPAIQASLPNSTILTIPDAGHWVHVDKPNELFEQIISFIRR